MKNFEYSPFTDVYVPYIVYPDVSRAQRMRFIWETLITTPLPLLTRWMIYRALL